MASVDEESDHEEEYTFFWMKKSPFSQWYPAKFVVDGIWYNCAEQYMMHGKAVLFDDQATAQLILQAKQPSQQKAYGRKVKNFNEETWNSECQNIVRNGNLAKHRELRLDLFETRGTTLVEASPVDTIWGIGLDASNPHAQTKATWRGKNLLGYILTEVRDELMRRPDFKKETERAIDQKMTTAQIEEGIKNLLFNNKLKPDNGCTSSELKPTAATRRGGGGGRKSYDELEPDAGKGPPWRDGPTTSPKANPDKKPKSKVQEKYMNSSFVNMVEKDLKLLTKAAFVKEKSGFPAGLEDLSLGRTQDVIPRSESSRKKKKNKGKKNKKGILVNGTRLPDTDLQLPSTSSQLPCTTTSPPSSTSHLPSTTAGSPDVRELPVKTGNAGSKPGEQEPSIGHGSPRELPVKSQSPENPRRIESKAGAQKAANLQESMNVDDLDPEVLTRLEGEFLFPLKKKSIKFQNAKFFCRLCEYHCDSMAHCNRHVKDNRHKRLKSMKKRDTYLKNLPQPQAAHIQAVDKVCYATFTNQGLSQQDLEKRGQAAALMKTTVECQFPDVTLIMYGSSLNGLGLKSSDLNLEITSADSPRTLQQIYTLLKKDNSGNFEGVRSDFSSKVPSVFVTLPLYDSVLVQLTINNAACCKTSQLLATYAAIDPRVVQLTATFRYWAKLCQVDEQESGTLPAYVFSLLTIYFLQQCHQPVLPVLHEMIKVDPKQPGHEHLYLNDVHQLKQTWTSTNSSTVGALWINLLRFYSIEFNSTVSVVSIRQKAVLQRSEKKWGSRKLAIEDPFQLRRNIAHTVSHTQVFEYINDRILAAYQYFGVPQSRHGSVDMEPNNEVQVAMETESSQSPVTETVSSQSTVTMETDSSQSPVTTETDNGCGTWVTEQKESQQEEQEGEVVQSSRSNCVISCTQDKIQETGQQCCDGDAKTVEDSSALKSAAGDEVESHSACCGETRCCSDCRDIPASPSCCEVVTEGQCQCSNSRLVKCDVNTCQTSGCSNDPSHPPTLTEEDLHFEMTPEVLADGKGPSVFCSVCQKEGHLKQVCPEENLPPLIPLPRMTPAFTELLDKILWKVPRDFEPRERELYIREQVLQELQSYVREIYPDAMLSLFGSSCNGFGFQHSDLDICLTFRAMPNGKEEGLNHAEMMNSLAKCLKRHQGLYQVLPITTAKVPIVKFRHGRSQLEGDISLYNTLAQHNTRLLLKYCDFDPRVKVLGYTMKVLAKCCDICDASRGSLSSYAYVLMVIYFLQQRQPPVLPVLQELYEGKKKPERLVDGYNAWFQDDIKLVSRLWKHWDANHETVSELWNGLLQFYTDSFNMKDYVISIRRLEPMSKFDKLWNSNCICIEDPFDLNHNLGSGLSRKMNIYIMKALRNARQLFGTPVDEVPRCYKTMQDYLFDARILTEGSPPNDRGCRICGKIGHFMKECPISLAKKARKEREERERQGASEGEGRDSQSHDTNAPSTPKYKGSQPVAIPGMVRRSESTGLATEGGSPLTSLTHSHSSSPANHSFPLLHHHHHHQQQQQHTPPLSSLFYSGAGSATPPSPHIYFPSPPSHVDPSYPPSNRTLQHSNSSPSHYVAMPTASHVTIAKVAEPNTSPGVTMSPVTPNVPVCFYLPNNLVFTSHSHPPYNHHYDTPRPTNGKQRADNSTGAERPGAVPGGSAPHAAAADRSQASGRGTTHHPGSSAWHPQGNPHPQSSLCSSSGVDLGSHPTHDVGVPRSHSSSAVYHHGNMSASHRNSPSGRLPSGGSQSSSSKTKIGSGRLAKNY